MCAPPRVGIQGSAFELRVASRRGRTKDDAHVGSGAMEEQLDTDRVGEHGELRGGERHARRGEGGERASSRCEMRGDTRRYGEICASSR